MQFISIALWRMEKYGKKVTSLIVYLHIRDQLVFGSAGNWMDHKYPLGTFRFRFFFSVTNASLVSFPPAYLKCTSKEAVVLFVQQHLPKPCSALVTSSSAFVPAPWELQWLKPTAISPRQSTRLNLCVS